MGKISERRVKEINEFFISNGEQKTSEHYNITIESLHRYLRTLKIDKTYRHPKIFIFDIETLFLKVRTWSLYPKYIDYKQIIQDKCILSWSGKWLYSSEVMGDVLTPQEATDRNDKRILEGIWKLMDESDVILAHNGARFDVKELNSRFLLHSLPPPSPYQVIDTLLVLKKHFRYTSNRLDYIGKFLVDDQKIPTNFELWERCDKGEQEALKEMLEYNKQDVNLLEEVYLMVLPYIKSHPNIALYSETNEECCPTCGSFNLKECGYYTTPAGRYESLRCEKCKSLSRRRKSTLDKKQRDNLLVSVAR